MADAKNEKLVTPVRVGIVDTGSEDLGKFPFDAWEFDLPSGSSPKLRIKSPWIFDAHNRYTDTAANLASANAVIPKGWIAFETDTLSFKIGDGTTAYNTLTYIYRGLPVAGEPSLGTPHPTSDANRTATLVVDTATNTAGVWSAAVTMTGVPVGAKAAWCACLVLKAASAPVLAVEAASGYTLSDITSGTNVYKYWHMGLDNIAGYGERKVLKIHLDSNGQFKWCTSISSSTVQIGSAIDYEM